MNISPSAGPLGQDCSLCNSPLPSEGSVAVVEPCKHVFHIKCATLRAASDSLDGSEPNCPIDHKPLTQLTFRPVSTARQQPVASEPVSDASEVEPRQALCAVVSLRMSIKNGLIDDARALIKSSAITNDTLYAMAKDLLAENDCRGYKSCLEFAALGGHAPAQELLGGLYLQGEHGVSQDDVKARYWLEQALNNGRTSAVMRLVNLLGRNRDSGREQEQVQLLEQGAQLDDPFSLFALGEMSRTGECRLIPMDTAKARSLLEKALNRGYGWALKSLSRLLLQGIGGPVEVKRALDLIDNQCQKNDSYGQLVMGDLFLAGGDTKPQHRDIAMYWYEKSAQQDNVYAKVSVSVLRRNEDPQQADDMLLDVMRCHQEYSPVLIKSRLTEMFDLMKTQVATGSKSGHDHWQQTRSSQYQAINKAVAALPGTAVFKPPGKKKTANPTTDSVGPSASKIRRLTNNGVVYIKTEPPEQHLFSPRHRIDNRAPLWTAEMAIKKEVTSNNRRTKTDFTKAEIPNHQGLRKQINEAISAYKLLNNDQREEYLTTRMSVQIHDGSIIAELKGQREVVACRSIGQWEILGHYAGKIYSEESYRQGVKTMNTTLGNIDRYSVEVTEGNLISGFRCGNITSLINANTNYDRRAGKDKRPVPEQNVTFLRHLNEQGVWLAFIIANRPIAAGQRLWLDYGKPYWDGIREPIWISGKEDSPPPS